MTQFSDNIAVGSAYYDRNSAANSTNKGTQVLGVVLSNVVVQQWGQIAAAVTSGVCAAQTATQALALTVNGTLASSGVATLSPPRCVTFTSTANESGVTVTIKGTDKYGAPLNAQMPGANNSTVTTRSAFLTVSGVEVGGALTSTQVVVGTSNTIGSDFKITNLGSVFGTTVDAVQPLATTITVVAGLTATATPGATTADVRGTVAFATAVQPDGSRYFTFGIVAVPTSGKEALYGQTPYTA